MQFWIYELVVLLAFIALMAHIFYTKPPDD